jgi:hypothetical protein
VLATYKGGLLPKADADALAGLILIVVLPFEEGGGGTGPTPIIVLPYCDGPWAPVMIYEPAPCWSPGWSSCAPSGRRCCLFSRCR